MTLKELNDKCKQNNIPDDVYLMSDSAAFGQYEMNGVWYSKEENMIIFTQSKNHFITDESDFFETLDPIGIDKEILLDIIVDYLNELNRDNEDDDSTMGKHTFVSLAKAYGVYLDEYIDSVYDSKKGITTFKLKDWVEERSKDKRARR